MHYLLLEIQKTTVKGALFKQETDTLHFLSCLLQVMDINPILHTVWLDNHALTLKVILQNIIFMKNPDFCIPS